MHTNEALGQFSHAAASWPEVEDRAAGGNKKLAATSRRRNKSTPEVRAPFLAPLARADAEDNPFDFGPLRNCLQIYCHPELVLAEGLDRVEADYQEHPSYSETQSDDDQGR